MAQAISTSKVEDYISESYWHVTAYDDTGRVVTNTDVRDKKRTKDQIEHWASTQALKYDWASYALTRK